MRNILSFSIGIVIFFLALYQCAGQQASPDLQKINAGKPYRVWLFSKTDRLRQVGGGEIYRLSDDSVTLVRPGRSLIKVNSYAVKDIDQIWLRQKSKIERGVLIGAAAGLLTGVLIGAVSGDDPKCQGQCWFDFSMTAGEKALLGGILLTPIGGVIGLAVGSAKIRIPIDRKQDKYLRVKDKLDTIRYVPQNK